MMRKAMFTAVLSAVLAAPALGLSLAPEEFAASRQLACVLAEQSLGYLTDTEYGARTHTVLDGFDETERNNILAKALGYVHGLMFALDDTNTVQVNARLQDFVQSDACQVGSYFQVTVSL